MNWTRLILKNLWFHRRTYLAVLVGIAVSTAVLTGGMIVGDSVRFSLQQLTNGRLGKIKYAMQTNDRFFRQELASSISAQSHLPVVPAILSGGIAINSEKNLRINQVHFIGIDDRFGRFWDRPPPAPGTDEAIISRNVAEKLILKPGDDLLLRIQRQGKAPSSAPFVSEKGPSVSIRVKVTAIADEAEMGSFSLKNNQTAPYNVFLSLKEMSSLLELSGYANLLLAADNTGDGLKSSLLDSVLWHCWEPEDCGLHFAPHHHPASVANPAYFYEITTDRIFFDDATADAILSTIPGCESILTYFVNSISTGPKSTPYSFVTAGNESFLNQHLGDREIILNDWLAKDLNVGTGDSVMLRYFLMGPLRSLREDSMRFSVKSIIPIDNYLEDPGLMPDFPGMSDAGNCREWETGAPINLKNIRDKDEQYWKDHRGTPKAFISLVTGQQIWGNRLGRYTAFRFNCMGADLSGVEKSLMSRIKPDQYGLSFRPVYSEGLLAARNSTDFGELFLSLSFFILLSALLLTALLFSLLARMRMAETGILSAFGFRKRKILGILAGEAFLVAFIGAIVGAFAGVLYNYFLILGLNTIWQEAVNTSLLVIMIKPATLLTGAASGIIASMIVLLFILWKNLRKPLSILVKNVQGAWKAKHGKSNRIFQIFIAIISLAIAICFVLFALIKDTSPDSSLSLIAGGLIIPGGLAWLNILLANRSQKPWKEIPGFPQMTVKNLALHRSRTLSAVALLSLGTFVIIITGANRKTFSGNETARSSGTGGFLLWTETVLPIMNDLNTTAGAGIFGLQDEDVLKPVHYIQLSGMEGDDASCLNLNQVSQPGLLGVPVDLFNRLNAFTFINIDPSSNHFQPWKLLSKSLASDMIPGVADQTVITWGLRKSVGDTLFYRDESGKILKIKLIGGLDNSIFQGQILVSDSLLRVFYPSIGGSRIMLVDGPQNQRDTIASRLENLFRDYGLMATSATERLSSFNAVENTYLSVFMILGGLGILIGTIGLGIVLLRNIADRKQELALYVALGFRKQFIFKLLLAEHTLILISGLVLGLISSIPCLLPLLISPAYAVPWLLIIGILTLVLINGFLWIYFPARRITAADPISGLRTE